MIHCIGVLKRDRAAQPAARGVTHEFANGSPLEIVPIWAQPGPGGGYALNVDAMLPLLNLTPAEAAASATALSVTRAFPFP